ncbi:hypothetical protein TFKS16_2913 [Tannerella forsythia KS16]|uniref:Uncharacterized protein n=1 Tax=Tannerella forsythia (strain ATCC 43037 / JCM 10827 / CCUG 21028 A / KCTC 5666 / FDC 338) TaxID=203275 RepID=G8UI64_TANFA|nr:hypothetical protein BFO_3229 [Tannerella forsythia 92A2]BAR53075.1 hypothetical protein TFKS16_2913 [Tannerella forsythia KS16]
MKVIRKGGVPVSFLNAISPSLRDHWLDAQYNKLSSGI